ncbi:helix-turn-helix domain-containing protein (plasmid) [Pseudochrobactrum algeriensis]|uniref:helix-turn-helix domain-containing protein n=1 Tax=Pseudochrobactrum algeriensis TaxID=2834768 RepID=UPI001BCCB10B|nr:helix-turn-helix domain-containing protein [Pseudochrobactrum algeriensis]QVQ38617.1 helix-turn-helix domain-containing protein [Pseudochrobactrum algeriensis]QVQ38738.1 helix-turn-helix domain-containing protein [Pseudochrobactrum algeriensis]QVQ42281.1 helix-turn-helix domain-containing protein [Pseudochrobactrum algeriensis]
MSAFESIKKGLDEALEFSKGNEAGSLVHEIILPEIDVAKIRAQTGLSQTDFARSIGVAKGTLLNWEQRRRTPQGPAQVLLALIERKPSVVQDLLGKL